jgi:D-glycero-D-manno-heptose 1,7-bisphosphate phosphatase
MTSRGAAFFDRDGVLNVDRNYVHRPDQICWIDGVVESIRHANSCGLWVVIVTNQSGVARGLYSEVEVDALHRWMTEWLRGQSARVDRFYYCPFHDEAVIPQYRVAGHPNRKPNPGMILQAIHDLSIDPLRSFMIGDKASDMAAAAAAGVSGYLFSGDGLLDLTRRAIAETRGE